MTNEMTAGSAGELSRIDGLAMEAQMYSANIRMNMFQLARVFSEARKILPRGDWGEWVKENAGVEMRTAQQMIATYERFGGMAALANVDRTKLYKMTTLPEGTEVDFMAANDVQNMSSREVEQAVKEYKKKLKTAEENAEYAERERKALENLLRAEKQNTREKAQEIAERIAAEANGKADEEMTAKIQEQAAEIERLTDAGRESIEQFRTASAENARLRRELEESRDILSEQQEEINRIQAELLDNQSAKARGEAEEKTGAEYAGDFESAAHAFIGACARMGTRKHSMAKDADTAEMYLDLISSVEKWCMMMKKALNSVSLEGGAVIE